MIELESRKRACIVPLCKNSREVLVRSAMEGAMGRVWVADQDTPSFCLVKLGDFSYVLGIPPRGKNALDLNKTLRTECVMTFITPENEFWSAWLENNLSWNYRKISRYALKNDETHFDPEKLKEYVKALPSEFTLKKIDRSIYRKVLKDDWSASLVENFADETQFLNSGMGYVILKDKEIVSGCSAYGYSDGMMSVEFQTRRDYRRQGLSRCAAAQFVLDCLKKGLKPNWDAASQHSVNLAEELGYTFDREYTVYQISSGD